MSTCIPVTMSDGSIVMANVDDGVTELPQSDIDQLEAFIAHVKARKAKKSPNNKTITKG